MAIAAEDYPSSDLMCYSGGPEQPQVLFAKSTQPLFAAIQKGFSHVNSGFTQQEGLSLQDYIYGEASVMLRT